MAKPKQVTGRFNFTVKYRENGTTLVLDGYEVALYPLTYSILDCLEHFCDAEGWEFVSHRYHYEGLTGTDDSTTVKRLFKGRSFARVFRAARLTYREGLQLCQW